LAYSAGGRRSVASSICRCRIFSPKIVFGKKFVAVAVVLAEPQNGVEIRISWRGPLKWTREAGPLDAIS